MSAPVGLFGRAWSAAARVRQELYQRQILHKVRLDRPVISIGNLTVGGTGKTPVTLALAEFLQAQGLRVGLIARNYKAQVKTHAKVDLKHPEAAAYFGDEPFLLASKLPQASVFVGPDKKKIAQWAREQDPGLQVFLVDDGFQHQGLARDLDLVLIDATDEKTFQPLPMGRGREGAGALNRAHRILLTKGNWATVEGKENMRRLLPAQIPVTEALFHTQWPEIVAQAGIGLFAGLARPETFHQLAQKKYFGRIRRTWFFRDHQVYGEKELRELRAFLQADPRAVLLTTEKDAVKILDPLVRSRMQVAGVRVDFQKQEDLFEQLRSVVF